MVLPGPLPILELLVTELVLPQRHILRRARADIRAHHAIDEKDVHAAGGLGCTQGFGLAFLTSTHELVAEVLLVVQGCLSRLGRYEYPREQGCHSCGSDEEWACEIWNSLGGGKESKNAEDHTDLASPETYLLGHFVAFYVNVCLDLSGSDFLVLTFEEDF